MNQDFRFDQPACIDYTSNHILKQVVSFYDFQFCFNSPSSENQVAQQGHWAFCDASVV